MTFRRCQVSRSSRSRTAIFVSKRYLTSRRLLLDGARPAEAAVAAGFYDQAHLARHFRRLVGVAPGRYRRAGATRPAGARPGA